MTHSIEDAAEKYAKGSKDKFLGFITGAYWQQSQQPESDQKGNDNGWISVETKTFPNNKQLVLFRCDNGLVLSGIYYEMDEFYNKHVFNDYQSGYPLDFITHWRNLPPAPKEQK